MAISRAKKEQLVQEYTEQLNGSDAIIITDYRGLKVGDLQELRAKVREAEGSFSIVKNTVVRRALEEVGLPVSEEMLTGPVAIGFCRQNVGGVAKVIVNFAKENELLTVKGGLMGNQVLEAAVIKELANLPSIDVLRAQLLGLINGPARQLAGVVLGSVRQLVNVLNAYSEESAEATADI